MLNMHFHRDPNLGGIYLALGQSIVIGAAELRPGRQSAIDPTRRVSLSACGLSRFESLVAFLELMEDGAARSCGNTRMCRQPASRIGDNYNMPNSPVIQIKGENSISGTSNPVMD